MIPELYIGNVSRKKQATQLKYFRLLLLVLFSMAITVAIAFLQSKDRKTASSHSTPHISDAMEALELWTQARAYPYSDIPPDAHYRAYMYSKSRIREFSASILTPPPWQSIGPINFSGRMISIALNPLNPNTVYAGSASGGLWRSYTGGLGGDWQRITTGFPVLGVNAIAIHAADTNIIYIGTGEVYRYLGSTGGIVIRTTRGSYGMGILKTTDGGSIWTKSLDWSYNQQRGDQAIRINPRNPRTVFAATSEGIYKSTDAGVVWDSVLIALMARDIAINPNDTNLILATCGNFASPGAGVYRSQNGGSSFTLVGGLPSFSGMGKLGVYAAKPNVVYLSLSDSTISVGSIWRSSDFGLTWSMINNDGSADVQGWYSRFLAVHPVDSTQIVRGSQSLYKSTNGGVSFTYIAACWADFHDYAQHPTNPNILYLVDDGGVWRSTNFGNSFQSVGLGLLTSQFYNGFSNSGTDSLLALGQVQDHFGWMYTGSTVWSHGGVDEIGWTAINQVNDMIMYAGNRDGGGLYKSTDRGITFFLSSPGFTGTSSWNAPFVLSPSNPNVLYFGRSKIFKSTNAGASWTVTNGNLELDANPALSMAISWTNPDIVFVGTAPRFARPHIFRTTNGGTAWTNVTGSLPDRFPMDLETDPHDTQTVYAAFGGFGTSHLFKSTDAGTNWADITGVLPDVPTTAIAVDPVNSNNVYVGNDIGVYVSTDAGINWMSFNDGLSEAIIVGDLKVSRSNRILRVATHSNGVFERNLFEPTVGVSNDRRIVKEFRLDQNYPNPFNPRTNIGFQTAEFGFVSLKIFDITGREVATLVHERKAPGTHTATWNADDMPSGVYFYRLMTKDFVQTKKMLLVK